MGMSCSWSVTLVKAAVWFPSQHDIKYSTNAVHLRPMGVLPMLLGLRSHVAPGAMPRPYNT